MKCKCGEETLFSFCDIHGVFKYKEECRVCGKKTTPICFRCAMSGVKKPREEFLASLSKEQRVLFDKYEKVDNLRTSVIILD